MMARGAIKRLAKEREDLISKPCKYGDMFPVDETLREWRGYVKGPPSTPYEDAVYEIRVIYPADYPFKPPQITFITPIFHPEINIHGEICSYHLSKIYNPSKIARWLLEYLHELLLHPLSNNCDLNMEAYKLLETSAEEFNRRVIEFKDLYV